ncbi:exported hypothetical protein [Candidatus Zixiibacteriota bacterium]|nr:exported hypothetical protein [candidate division Zixibacteria bacterium]
MSTLQSTFKIAIIYILIGIPAVSASADVKTDITATSGYTSNLLNDSTRLEDSYSTINAALFIYPVAPLEFEINNRYTYYSRYYKLSNFQGSAGFKFIPTRADSRLSVALNARFSSQIYRDSINIDNSGITNISSNNDNYDLGFGLGYRFASNLNARLGSAYNYLKYTDYKGANRGTWKFFTGINMTIFGSNSIDVETGFATMDYRRFKDSIYIVPLQLTPAEQLALLDSVLRHDNLHSFYVSPRFSRPFGSKTGFNIIYSYRKFYNFADKRVYGLNSGFLSPWASVYEGTSITSGIKSYIIPGFTLNLGAGYWDKTFFKSLERPDGRITDPTPTRKSHISIRRDFQTRVYAGLTRSFGFAGGSKLEATLTYEFENNHSINTFYDYKKSGISAILDLKM